MKVVFMGTPDFSVGTLEALVEAVHDSPLDRRCSAVSRKQGCMNVDASVFRHVQNLFWNNLAECNDNDHIRLHFPDLLDRLCIPHAARLIDRKASTQAIC